jgi:hypothetical protein
MEEENVPGKTIGCPSLKIGFSGVFWQKNRELRIFFKRGNIPGKTVRMNTR